MAGVGSSRVHDLTSYEELHRFIVPGMISFQLNGSSVQLDSFWSCQDIGATKVPVGLSCYAGHYCGSLASQVGRTIDCLPRLAAAYH